MTIDTEAPPFKKQKTMETTIIDPLGDILVHLRDTSVQVSSYVLSLASPVFKAMLNGNFKEGQSNASSKDHAQEICLPEDDTTSFVLLSKILHHQQSVTSKFPDASALLALATLCDKYQCVGAVGVYFDKWILDNLNSSEGTSSPEKISKLLLVSYIANIANAFKSISEGILSALRTQARTLKERNCWYGD